MKKRLIILISVLVMLLTTASVAIALHVNNGYRDYLESKYRIMSAVNAAGINFRNSIDQTSRQRAINDGILSSKILNIELNKVKNSLFLDDDFKSYMDRGEIIISEFLNEKKCSYF